MDCPHCGHDEEKYGCGDGLLHGIFCKWAPEACPECRRRVGVEYKDRLEHNIFCTLAYGACKGCHRREGIEYYDGLRHDKNCGYEKYEKAARRAKKHRKTMGLLAGKEKKPLNRDKKNPNGEKKDRND